jgi:hypothetical protein
VKGETSKLRELPKALLPTSQTKVWKGTLVNGRERNNSRDTLRRAKDGQSAAQLPTHHHDQHSEAEDSASEMIDLAVDRRRFIDSMEVGLTEG